MLLAAVYAFLMPLGLGIAAVGPDAISRANPGMWGTIPQWIQAIGVPAALLGSVWVAQTSAREARRKELRDQAALIRLLLRYGEDLVNTLSIALHAYRSHPIRLGHEQFDHHAATLAKFPVDKLHDTEAALALHDLQITLAFFRPRYETLYKAPKQSPTAREAIRKLVASRASAKRAVRTLQDRSAIAIARVERSGGWVEDELAPEP